MCHYKLLFILFFSISLIFNQAFAQETVKLSPQLRTSTINQESVKSKKINMWRKKFIDVQILDATQVENTPRVIADRTAKLMSIKGDEIYVNKLNSINYHASMGVYRIGAPIKDNETKQVLGFPFYHLADAKLTKYNVQDNLSLINLSSAGKEVITGDRVLNKDKDALNVKPNKNKNLQGKVVSIIYGVKNAEKDKNVILNIGRDNRLQAGDLLTVVKQTTVKRIVQLHEDKVFKTDNALSSERDLNAGKTVDLPCEPIATLLVYRVFKNSSLALVVENKEAVNLNQEVRGFTELN